MTIYQFFASAAKIYYCRNFFSMHIVHANLNFLRRVASVAAMGIFDTKIKACYAIDFA
jgi:hypothetical protein